MIKRLNRKNVLDVFEAVSRIKDYYNDFYITINKERKFLTDLNLIKKTLDNQEVYALEEKEIKGLLIIYREKGFRPYVKILSDNKETEKNMIKFFMWNFTEIDLYIKLKKTNPLTKFLQYINPHTKRPQYGFIFSGDRGQEVLLFRKGEKKINKGVINGQYNK